MLASIVAAAALALLGSSPAAVSGVAAAAAIGAVGRVPPVVLVAADANAPLVPASPEVPGAPLVPPPPSDRAAEPAPATPPLLVPTPGPPALPGPGRPVAPPGVPIPGPRPSPPKTAEPFRPPSPLVAVRAPQAPVVDGKLDDAAWTTAPVSRHFTEQYPDEGTDPAEPTEVRAFYDDQALYFGIRCVQKTAPVTARLTRRDRVTSADRITVDISSRADRLTAFHFGVNAAGVLDDGIFYDDTTYSAAWDENWEAGVSIDADGWSVELRIPFRVLRFDPSPVQRWGLEVERYTEARHEWDHWAYRARNSATFVSSFGVLEGITGIAPSRSYELRLAGVGRYRHRDLEARSGTLGPAHDLRGSVELGAKAHPTQGTTFDLAVNPDFGQVESDQVVLNLSTFETFFPEKRPFFLEGIDTFATPRTVLYTRRVGAAPSDPTVTGADKLVDHVDASRIWTAAKLVGAAGPRTNLGVLSALVAENTAQIQITDPNGVPARTTRVASPLSLYNALRARRLWGRGGDVGLLATSVNRFEPAGAARTTQDAYVAALDGHWYSPSGDYRVAGQVVGSVLAGDQARKDRDGMAIETGRPGTGGTLTAAKAGGKHWLASTTQAISDRRLDYNDFGYLDRKNDYFAYADLTYRTFDPWWRTNDRSAALAVSHRQTLDGLPLGDNVRFQIATTFKSFWSVNAAVYHRARFFDDRETGDGAALERAALTGGEVWVGADSRNVVSGSLWVQYLDLANGSLAQASATVLVRPTPHLELEVDPTVYTTRGEPRFVSKDAGFYTFGRLQATNLGVTVRATVGLLPTLTLQLYGQLFLATKDFESFSRYGNYASGQTGQSLRVRIADLSGHDPAPATNPDSQQTILNVNLVLRWEFKLGSVIYFVYTRAQSPGTTLPPGNVPRLEVAPLLENRGAVDALILKISHWWG